MDYFITGSRAYGPYGKDSDLDLVMSIKDSDEFRKKVKGADVEFHYLKKPVPYADKVWYFEIFGILINVISVKSQVDFECWKETTRRLVLIDDIVDKEDRVQMFKSIFCDVHSGYPTSIGRNVSYEYHR